MAGYRNLAAYYGALFPVSEACRRYLAPEAARCREMGLPWLDVGCGTGNLLAWLEGEGVDARGLEPDADFAREARRRLRDGQRRVLIGGMEDVARCYGSLSFGAISCLGNVLAHAATVERARDFLGAAHSRLAPGGAMIVQIVNFDRVFASKDGSFPVLNRVALDGTPLTFERRYQLGEYQPGGPLIFDTVLSVGGERIENSARLLPLRKSDLAAAAREVFGKGHVAAYGDYDGAPWTARSPATILVCRQRPVLAR